jgi:predicted nucleic acid-binding protein
VLSLDTNVLVYAVDATAGPRHAVAKQLIDDVAAANCALTEQSLFEFFHAATRKAGLTAGDAALVVRRLAKDFPVLFPPWTIVGDALALQAAYELSIWDSRLLATCAAHGCNHLLSEDLQDGAQYGTVAVVNPFRAANAALLRRALAP